MTWTVKPTTDSFFCMNDKELTSCPVLQTVHHNEYFIYELTGETSNPMTQTPCILMSWDYIQNPHHKFKKYKITTVSPE